MANSRIAWLLATVLLTTAPTAEAQRAVKPAKIGWLATRSASGSQEASELFRREFVKFG